MADLGAVGTLPDPLVVALLDTAAAQDISLNPITGVPFGAYAALPYRQNWKSVSGNIKNDAGANTARRVYLFRRGTGELVGSTVSDPTTGAYSIASPYPADEHMRIVLDDDAGVLYNDRIDRVFPV